MSRRFPSREPIINWAVLGGSLFCGGELVLKAGELKTSSLNNNTQHLAVILEDFQSCITWSSDAGLIHFLFISQVRMPNSDTLPIHILAPDLGFTVSGEAFTYWKHGRAKVSGQISLIRKWWKKKHPLKLGYVFGSTCPFCSSGILERFIGIPP